MCCTLKFACYMSIYSIKKERILKGKKEKIHIQNIGSFYFFAASKIKSFSA